MPITARGGLAQKIASAFRSEPSKAPRAALGVDVEVPARVVVILNVNRRTRIVGSWATFGKAGNAVQQLSRAASRLGLYRKSLTKEGEPSRIQVQAWMADGRRIVVIDDHSTRGVITWKPGELFSNPASLPTS